jgi:peptidyl-prolyl cis-trans isomerase-like 4
MPGQGRFTKIELQMSVLIETSLGDIVIDLHYEACPKACTNFIKLCKIKYYNNVVIHRIQKDLCFETGDPLGTGKGGESVFSLLSKRKQRYFQDEIKPSLIHDKMGTVSMTNGGPNTNGSQFFITTSNTPLPYLDGKHTIFGQVVEGLDVIVKINKAYCDAEERPLRNIRIRHTIILDG